MPRPRVLSCFKYFAIIIILLMVWVVFRTETIARSASWEPMASLILKSTPKRQLEDSYVTENRIPQIIHQTWKTEEIPRLFKPWISSWLNKNPDWDYWFWTDESIEQFISSKYPRYLKLYKSYPIAGYKVDVFRYFVLFEYGGVYADLDMEAILPLSEYIKNIPHNCFLSQEPLEHAHFLSSVGIPLVSNALMGCSPGHPFFADVIRVLPRRAGIFGWNDVLTATGPYMLTDLYKSYTTKKLFSKWSNHTDIFLSNPYHFHPTMDDSMVDTMRRMCMETKSNLFVSSDFQQTRDELCRNVVGHRFNSKPTGHAYANHHWTHTWNGKRNDPWGVFNDVSPHFPMKDILMEYKKQ